MRRTKTIVILLVSPFCVLIMGFECWLEPAKFRCNPDDEIRVDFMVGENFVGDPWNAKQYHADVLQWHSLSGVKDYSEGLKAGNSSNFSVRPPKEGTQVISLQSNTLSQKWESAAFNTFLEENGVENVIALRKQANKSNAAVTEGYSCFSKVMFQVGQVPDDIFKKKVGHPLEIIPDKNPYLLKTGDHLGCLVLFQGKPSPHTLVKVWSRLNHTTFIQNIYTENDGTIRFPISTKGPWMVSVIKMVPGAAKGVDWQSLRGSLVFGI